MVTRFKKDGTRAKQPGPRPGKGAMRPPPPDHPSFQRSVRFTPEELAAYDAYTYQVSLRTGIKFSYADLVRRGLKLALAEPLPPMPVVRTCVLVPHGGTGNLNSSSDSRMQCLQCMRVLGYGDRCPETGLEPGATSDHRR